MVPYHFLGTIRACGFTDSPNLWAIFCSSSVFIGVAACSYVKKYLSSFAAISIGIICIIISESQLVLTFSRGGWIAFVTAILLMVLNKETRRIALITLIIFFLMIVTNPYGLIRAHNLSASLDDLSVSHRLVVWKDTCALIAAHPWKGISGTFLSEYSFWYQSPDRTEIYSSPICTYLTLGARFGIWLPIILLSTVIIIVIALFKHGADGKHIYAVIIAACLLDNVIAAGFSSFLASPQALILWCSILIIVICYHVYYRSEILKLYNYKLCGSVILVISFLSSLVLLEGVRLLALYPKHETRYILLSGTPLPLIIASPRGRDACARIIIFPSTVDTEFTNVRQLVRPLANDGFEVILLPSLDISKYSQYGSQYLNEQTKLPTILLGSGIGGTAAIIQFAKKSLSAVVAINPQIYSPVAENSADNYLRIINIPLLAIFSIRTTREDVLEDSELYAQTVPLNNKISITRVDTEYMNQEYNLLLPFVKKFITDTIKRNQ